MSPHFSPAPYGGSPYGQAPGARYSPAPRGEAMPGPGPQPDYDRLNSRVPSRVDQMEHTNPDLSVQDRLKLPLINYKRRQGEDMIDEGRNSRDDSKVRWGLQHINEANERMDRLKGPGDGDSRSHNGERNGRGHGRRERR